MQNKKLVVFSSIFSNILAVKCLQKINNVHVVDLVFEKIFDISSKITKSSDFQVYKK